MTGRFVIFGPGGFGREIYRPLQNSLIAINDMRPIIYAADDPSGDVIPASAINDDDDVLIALGDSAARRQISERIKGRPARLVAPTCIIGQNVEIGAGSVFCDFAMVTCDASVGKYFQCNIYSYVAHDCKIGDFVTFAPQVSCNGNVTIGDGTYVGTGACIRPGLVIGSNVTIGMGAVVTKNVPDGATVIGNPAAPLVR